MTKLIRNIFEEEAEAGHNDTVKLHRLIKKDEIDGKLQTYNYAWLEPGEEFETHVHEDCTEFFLILDGSGVLQTSEHKSASKIHSHLIKSGDFISIMLNTYHSIKNSGNQRLNFITLRLLVR